MKALMMRDIENEYQKLLEKLSPEQKEVITKYCSEILASGAETEEFLSLEYKGWTEIKKYGKICIRNEGVKLSFTELSMAFDFKKEYKN